MLFIIDLCEILLFAAGLEGKGERKQTQTESDDTQTKTMQKRAKDLNGYHVGVYFLCVFLLTIACFDSQMVQQCVQQCVQQLQLQRKLRTKVSKHYYILFFSYFFFIFRHQ